MAYMKIKDQFFKSQFSFFKPQFANMIVQLIM